MPGVVKCKRALLGTKEFGCFSDYSSYVYISLMALSDKLID